jgi:arylsulfatase A-like enzyme
MLRSNWSQKLNKPNVILLTIDTLRADRLGCYGHPSRLTPNIDGLAASGMRFEQAITGGSWTQAAFPVMLTSSYASMYGGCLGPLTTDRPSPIETLAANGYTNGGFSTSPLLSRSYGYDRGFHQFFDLVPDESDPILRKVKGGERILRQQWAHKLLGMFGVNWRPACRYVSAEETNKIVFTWLDSVESPFFAWVHYMDIHWPYHLEWTLTQPESISKAWRDLAHLYQVNWNGTQVTVEEKAHYIRLYEQAVQYVDDQVGKLISELEKLGKLENTLLILASDHGEEFLEHGRWGHWENNLYDEILKVPLIIKLPHLKSSRVIQNQVRLLDLMPTILDLCECPSQERMEGVSFASLWDGEKTPYLESESISEMVRDDWHKVAIRNKKFKFIWDNKDPIHPELYNLLEDPEEQNDVREDHAQVVEQFSERLTEHLETISKTKTSEIGVDIEMDHIVLSRLRDLGYVE